MSLENLIKEIEVYQAKKELPDDYLRDNKCDTREELKITDEFLIGDYSYGVVFVEINEVLPYLKELKQLKDKNKETIESDLSSLETMEDLANQFKQKDVVAGEYLLKCINDWQEELNERK